ncbi:hypothetical protein [Sorangium sp. So ce131]|uniref:hypothetical protein n=1 Tax=Sorangium sp. So ce131 TaxID=3133282 RepID=UPI003F5D63D8
MRAAIVALAASSALFCLALPVRGAEGVPCSFYGIDPGAPVAGGEVILDDGYAEQLARAGAGAARVELRLDGAEGWGEQQLAAYDAIVDAVRGAGLEPLGLLSHRAARGGQSDWNDDPDEDGNNTYVEEFAGAAEAIMTRFAGRVVRWEIWSQPNCVARPDYADDPQNAGCTYVLPRVLAQILAQIRARNEALFNADAISLTTGGLLATDEAAPSTALDYLRELYAQPVWDDLEARYGRRYPWEYLGYQPFIHQAGAVDPLALGGYLDEARDLAEERGDRSDLVLTGMSWESAFAGEELQAANLQASFDALAAREDVAGVVWARYRDDPRGDHYDGLAGEGGVPKRSLAAFREAAAGCEAGGGGAGAGGGAGGSSSSGGSIPVPSNPGGNVDGRPISGQQRESACSYAAGATHDPRGLAGVGWIALLAVAVSALARASARARRAS